MYYKKAISSYSPTAFLSWPPFYFIQQYHCKAFRGVLSEKSFSTHIPKQLTLSTPYLSAFLIFDVSFYISVNFRYPIFDIWRRPYEPTTIMFVPETAIHKNDCMILRQNNIGASRQVVYIFPVSKAPRKQVLSDKFFRLCVCAPNMWHVFAAYFFWMIISHFIFQTVFLSAQADLQAFLQSL